MDPHFSSRASLLDGRDSLFVLLENHLKKTIWSRHLFLFYFKGEKQNKKEKTLNVTLDKKMQVWKNRVLVRRSGYLSGRYGSES